MKLLRRKPARVPVTHDFTKRYLSHDYIFRPVDGGLRGDLTMWSEEALHRGDFLLLQNGDGSTRYRIDEAERMYAVASDPPPMWTVKATFFPRESASRPGPEKEE